MLVDTTLLAKDLEDCREFINLILYLLEQDNLDHTQRDRFLTLIVQNLAYDLDMYLKVLKEDPSVPDSDDRASGMFPDQPKPPLATPTPFSGGVGTTGGSNVVNFP